MTAVATPTAQTYDTLNRVFDTYGIVYINLEDQPGNGLEYDAYDANDYAVIVPNSDELEDDGIDPDAYLQELLYKLGEFGGNYHRLEGTLSRANGKFSFKGNVTTHIDC